MSWQKVKLGDVCRPKQWKTISTCELKSTGYPVYGANGKIGFYDHFTHENETLMITCRGATCGNVHISEPFSYINGNAMSLDNMSNKLSIRFLYYFFIYRGFTDVLSGSAQPQITGESLKTVEIPLPPLDAQKKIADILDKADTLRRKDAELIKKYDELAQSIFIDMFGDPVTNPKGWEIKKLSEVCFKITDGTHQSPKFQDYGIPFIFVSNIVNNNINYKTNTYISEEEYSVLSRRTPIEVGNILLTTVGSYGNPAIIHSLNPFAFQRHIAFIQPNHELINYKFLFAQLKSDSVKRQIDKKVRGVAQKTLNLSDLKNIEIWLPNLELQNLFGCILDNTNEIMDTVTYCVDNSEQLFQSLLQRAFNGELVH